MRCYSLIQVGKKTGKKGETRTIRSEKRDIEDRRLLSPKQGVVHAIIAGLRRL